MSRLFICAGIAAMLSTSAAACSCGDLMTLTTAQRRVEMQRVALIAQGRVIRVTNPIGCVVAPIRWFHALFGMRLPVRHRLVVEHRYWGTMPRSVDVVQWQYARWNSCHPGGSWMCEPPLPRGSALWVLHSEAGEMHYAGRCGLELANYFLTHRREFSERAAPSPASTTAGCSSRRSALAST